MAASLCQAALAAFNSCHLTALLLGLQVEKMRDLVPKDRRAGFQTWACREVTKHVRCSTPVPPGFNRILQSYIPHANRRLCITYYVLQDDDGRKYFQCIMPWVIYSRLPDYDIDKLPWNPKAPKKRSL